MASVLFGFRISAFFRVSGFGLRISPAARSPVSVVFEPSRRCEDTTPHPSGRRGWVAQHPGHLRLGGQSGLDERPGALGQDRGGGETIEVTCGDAVAEGVVEPQPFDERQSSAITSAQAGRAALARAIGAPAAEQPLVKDQLQGRGNS